MAPSEIVQGQLDAYNARDVERFASFYADDVEIFRPPRRDPVIAGRDALVRSYRERFADPTLRAALVGRTTIGRFVVDHERVSVGGRTFDAIGQFEVEGERIVRVWFFDSA